MCEWRLIGGGRMRRTNAVSDEVTLQVDKSFTTHTQGKKKFIVATFQGKHFVTVLPCQMRVILCRGNRSGKT